MNRTLSTRTLALTHTPAQALAWYECGELATEIDRLKGLRVQPGANVSAINARITTLEGDLAAHLRTYDASL